MKRKGANDDKYRNSYDRIFGQRNSGSTKGIPTRDELMEQLRKDVLVVTFKKLDGDERTMPCTLITSFLPPAKKDDPMTQKKVREVSDKVCAVWAVESKGFRSFRYDRVTKVEVIEKADYKVRLGEFWKGSSNEN